MAQSTVAALAERNKSPHITLHASKHIKLLQNFVDGLSNNSKSLQNNACFGIQRSGSEQQSDGIFLFSKICSKKHTFREVIVLWGG